MKVKVITLRDGDKYIHLNELIISLFDAFGKQNQDVNGIINGLISLKEEAK